MKTSKIPGLGRFGTYIDDVDLVSIGTDEWNEIGKIHLQSLVTVIRPVNPNFGYKRYYELLMKWGPARWSVPEYFYRKYGKSWKDLFFAPNSLDREDFAAAMNFRRWTVDPACPHLSRVTPKVDKKGNSLGSFGDGELLWHSNESADIAFTPNVALLGWENVVGSATGFCTSPDWYDKQTESFKSELDEMIAIHNYKPKSVNAQFNPDQEANYRMHFASEKNARFPLVIKSPGGIKGIHLGVNTLTRIEGLNKKESDAIIDLLKEEIISEKYIYNHWYDSDKEIAIFDNSVTLHNRSTRSGSTPERVAYRLQHDLDYLTDEEYRPFHQSQFNKDRIKRIENYRSMWSPNP